MARPVLLLVAMFALLCCSSCHAERRRDLEAALDAKLQHIKDTLENAMDGEDESRLRIATHRRELSQQFAAQHTKELTTADLTELLREDAPDGDDMPMVQDMMHMAQVRELVATTTANAGGHYGGGFIPIKPLPVKDEDKDLPFEGQALNVVFTVLLEADWALVSPRQADFILAVRTGVASSLGLIRSQVQVQNLRPGGGVVMEVLLLLDPATSQAEVQAIIARMVNQPTTVFLASLRNEWNIKSVTIKLADGSAMPNQGRLPTAGGKENSASRLGASLAAAALASAGALALAALL